MHPSRILRQGLLRMFLVAPGEAFSTFRRHWLALSVGVDIGRDAVRVVVLRRGRQGFCLAGLGSAEVAADARAALRIALREACRRVAWRPRRVVLAVPADAVLVRVLPIDAEAGPEEQWEAVERAVRLLPVPRTELRLAWAPTRIPVVALNEGAAGRPGAHQLCMIAVRRQEVLERQILARDCGLGRVMVDVDVFAAMRGLLLGSTPADIPLLHRAPLPMLIDQGDASLRALVWPQGGAPLLRVLPAPRAVDAEALGRTVADLVGELAGAAGASPETLWVSGGRGSNAPALQAISRWTGLPVGHADPFRECLVDASVARPSGPAAALWLTAYGLALRGTA